MGRAMFRWACLGVTVVFLSVTGWMLNDMRLELRRSGQLLRTTGQTVNEHLPIIMERTRKATDNLAENLPEIAKRVRTTMATVSELTDDVRQLRELLGLPRGTSRDNTLAAYATGMLDTLERSGGVIGLKKALAKGMKNPVPAKEWVVGARREAMLLVLLGRAKSKQEMLSRLSKNWLGSNWYIQIDDRDPVTVLDWLKANHPPTRAFSAQ